MVESKHQWKAWLFLAPAIILLLIFTVWPIFNTVAISFLEDYDKTAALGGKTFEFGLGNFINIINYRKFGICLQNTILLCVLTVPLSTIIALILDRFFYFVWRRKYD